MYKPKANILHLNDRHTDFFWLFFKKHPQPMWVFDIVTLKFLEVNDAAVAHYGYTRDEFIEMTIKDIRPPGDVEAVEIYVQKLGDYNNDGNRWRHIKKDGSYAWVTVSSFQVSFMGMAARLVAINDITKNYEQEINLRRINTELTEYKRAIITGSIVSITNSCGIIEYANENFVALTGYSQQELVGSSHNIIGSGYHPATFWKGMWNTVMTGKKWRAEVCNRKKNGDIYWVETVIIPVRNETGLIDRLFSIRIDITARKQKEKEVFNLNNELMAKNEALIKSERELEKLSLVARFTASKVMILNENSQITWVNDAFTRVSGYTLQDAWGKRPSELLHGPNSNPDTTRYIKQAIKDRLPFNAEVIHYSKNGQERNLLSNGQPVLDDDGNLLQYVIVETEITEMKRQQEALKNSEIKLKAFFTGTASLHLLVDKEFKVLAFNRVAEEFAEKILHTTLTEGDHWPSKLPGPMQATFQSLVSDAVENMATLNRQIEIPLPDGTKTLWVINYLPAYDRTGTVIGCTISAIDITERMKAEETITSQNEALRKIAWEQSHVVRAPLANILSIVTLLEGCKNDDTLLSSLKHETEKLDNIIRDIVNKTAEAKHSY